MYNYIAYRMADVEATEDVVSEAFLLAARSFHRYDPSRAKFSTWVTSIAVNCVSTYYRKQRPTTDLESVPQAAVSVPGEQGEVDDREFVRQLLGVLDEEERELVALKYHEGKRNVDIAAELGMNASTVATKLSKALAKMRAYAHRTEATSGPR